MKAIVFTICVIAGTVSFLEEGFSATGNREPRSLKFVHRRHGVETRRPALQLDREVAGVIPNAIRGGNPLEMLDPFVPGKYGTGEENTVVDSEEPGRGQGIKLLSIEF